MANVLRSVALRAYDCIMLLVEFLPVATALQERIVILATFSTIMFTLLPKIFASDVVLRLNRDKNIQCTLYNVHDVYVYYII